MYKAFFGMENTPFSRKVPPESLYSSQAMDECLGRMKYVSSEQLLAVVTSDPGCGKSTMIRMLAEKYSGVLCEENDQDRFLNSGFPIIHRDDDRTAEETLALVEKTFGLQ